VVAASVRALRSAGHFENVQPETKPIEKLKLKLGYTAEIYWFSKGKTDNDKR
jgi:hypothetical protein